jgi:hypothetical protein
MNYRKTGVTQTILEKMENSMLKCSGLTLRMRETTDGISEY